MGRGGEVYWNKTVLKKKRHLLALCVIVDAESAVPWAYSAVRCFNAIKDVPARGSNFQYSTVVSS